MKMKSRTRISERKRGTRRQLSDMGAIFLCDLYDRLDTQPFCDAISDFAGLAELLAGNNAPEACAIKRLVAAEAVLNRIRQRVSEA
jgi:hypothetical protein